ncbi:hypothetical protein ANCCAN_06566 [Ancylostoma caninum]|uniref:SCP domain-containing protein n=1 Tax=Ancylostoma caninum TaxID=29170 RepID=A0A368GUK2_ANCCA|nr:hypothetical protein ANCCAN_06566 [Ancylostoma caninum]
MLPALVVLSLCVGSLLAEEGIKCKSDKVSPEMRKYIVDYHNRYRENTQKIKYDCGLEKKARQSIKGDSIDASKMKDHDFNEATLTVHKGQDAKEYLSGALRRWYWKDQSATSHTNMLTNTNSPSLIDNIFDVLNECLHAVVDTHDPPVLLKRKKKSCKTL